MKDLTRSIRLSTSALASLTILALAACGGGGGDSSGSASVATVDPIDTYIGTLSLSCYPSDVKDATTMQYLHATANLVSTAKVSSTKASYRFSQTYFDSADCSGTARRTDTVADSNTFITVDGSTSLGGVSVDKATMSEGVLFPGISGGTIIINGLLYPGYYSAPQSLKTLLYIDSSKNLFGGNTSALDSTGYPTALQSTALGKKQ